MCISSILLFIRWSNKTVIMIIMRVTRAEEEGLFLNFVSLETIKKGKDR